MWQERKQDVARTAVNDPAEGLGVARIGKGMLIKGRVESRQDLYIDGEVQGTLTVPDHRLTIGPNGRAGAGAKAREVDVMGVIDGDIESSEKVSVRKGGRLVGDVRTAGIVIEDGAYFKGSIDIVKRRPTPAPDPPRAAVLEPATQEV